MIDLSRERADAAHYVDSLCRQARAPSEVFALKSEQNVLQTDLAIKEKH